MKQEGGKKSEENQNNVPPRNVKSTGWADEGFREVRQALAVHQPSGIYCNLFPWSLINRAETAETRISEIHWEAREMANRSFMATRGPGVV